LTLLLQVLLMVQHLHLNLPGSRVSTARTHTGQLGTISLPICFKVASPETTKQLNAFENHTSNRATPPAATNTNNNRQSEAQRTTAAPHLPQTLPALLFHSSIPGSCSSSTRVATACPTA
jgi:hypothetical protein